MIAEKSPQVKKAVVRLLELSNDERTRLLYESRHKWEWDNAARMKDARNDARAEIARNMLADGEPIEKITRYTGLPGEALEALR